MNESSCVRAVSAPTDSSSSRVSASVATTSRRRGRRAAPGCTGRSSPAQAIGHGHEITAREGRRRRRCAPVAGPAGPPPRWSRARCDRTPGPRWASRPPDDTHATSRRSRRISSRRAMQQPRPPRPPRRGAGAFPLQRLQALLLARQRLPHVGRGGSGGGLDLLLRAHARSSPSGRQAATAPRPAAPPARPTARGGGCAARGAGARGSFMGAVFIPLGQRDTHAVSRMAPCRTRIDTAHLRRHLLAIRSPPPGEAPRPSARTPCHVEPRDKRASCASRLEYHEFPTPGKIAIAATQAARQPARPGAGLFARRGGGPARIVADPANAFRYTSPRQPGRRHHQRHRRAGPGRHRPAGGQAGDGRQGRAVQEVRRHRRLRHRGQRENDPTSWSTSSPRSSPPSAASTSRTSRRRTASTSSASCASA